jgi:hypothetical protein
MDACLTIPVYLPLNLQIVPVGGINCRPQPAENAQTHISSQLTVSEYIK